MKTSDSHPSLVWVDHDGTSPLQFHEEKYPGTVEDAIAHLQSRANRREVLFGQVLAADGMVLTNIAPSA